MKPIEAREGNNGGRGPQGKAHAGPGWTAEHDAGKFAAFTGDGRRAPRPEPGFAGTTRVHVIICESQSEPGQLLSVPRPAPIIIIKRRCQVRAVSPPFPRRVLFR